MNILLLVDSLPNPADPDPHYHFKNIFVSRPMLALAQKHHVFWPIFRPRLAGVLKRFYARRGGSLHFPEMNRCYDSISVSDVSYTHLPRVYPALKSRALNRYIDRQKSGFDLVHCHSVYDLGLAGLDARERFGLPLVVTVYGTDVNWLFEEGPGRASERIARGTRRVLAGADRVICVSRDLMDKVESLGVPRDRLRWIPNGVDTDIFFPGAKEKERLELGWPLKGKIILFVGNLIPTKGVMELIEAASILAQRPRTGDFSVVMAGPSGQYGDEMQNAINRLGLGRQIIFTGSMAPEKVPGLMRACDIFCLPSWREGWPLSVIEAMACGRPVVATDVGGIPEIVDDPGLGFLCPPRDAAALADSLGKSLEERWDPIRIARAVDQYSYKALCPRIESVYRELAPEESEQSQ